ncbi:MAG: hypothetical protein KC493_16335 [Bacteriovoracaceae bacterium]|nr:hypothetical protein [Bacteriovoracaceae bacterium]
MKHFVTKIVVVVVMLSWNLLDAQANANLKAHAECPDKFVGTVTKVSELAAPFASLNRLEVEFKVDHSTQGNFRPKRKLNVLKFGEHSFTKGMSYKLELQDDLICKVKPLISRT